MKTTGLQRRQYRCQAMNCLPQKPPEMTAEVFIYYHTETLITRKKEGTCE